MIRNVVADDNDLRRVFFIANNTGAQVTSTPTIDFYQTDFPYNLKSILGLIGQLQCRVNYLEHVLHIKFRECFDDIKTKK